MLSSSSLRHARFAAMPPLRLIDADFLFRFAFFPFFFAYFFAVLRRLFRRLVDIY